MSEEFPSNPCSEIPEVVSIPEPADHGPDPTEEDLNDPVFNAIWDVIKTWDVNVGDGPMGATGNHVMKILQEVRKVV